MEVSIIYLWILGMQYKEAQLCGQRISLQPLTFSQYLGQGTQRSRCYQLDKASVKTAVKILFTSQCISHVRGRLIFL